MGAFIRRLLSQLLDVKSLVTLMLTGVFGHRPGGRTELSHHLLGGHRLLLWDPDPFHQLRQIRITKNTPRLLLETGRIL